MDIKKLIETFKSFFQGFSQAAYSHIERELADLEFLFSLVLFSFLLGDFLVSPYISLELLPDLEEEFNIFISRSLNLDDTLSLYAEMVEF